MRLALNIVFSAIGILLLAGVGIFFFKPGLDGPARNLDINGDDYLTADELPPILRQRLDAVDSSGDGRIGPVELRLYMLTEFIHGGEIYQPPPYEGEYRFLDLGRYLAESLVAGDMAGAVLMVGHAGETVFAMSMGNLTPRTQLPIASATKWITAAVVGALYDAGQIDIERPVGEWASDVPASHEAITVPQMMAHVSGMDARFRVVRARTLDEAAERILEIPLQAEPGQQFRYGASSMILAAWIAERQTGRPWRELARQHVFEPLGMNDTAYANPIRPLEYGLDMAPEVASGIHSTPEDYMKFLSMIAAKGRRADGFKVLKASTVRKMEVAQSIGAERVDVPPGVTHDFEYAMGTWCERWTDDGQCTLLHSQGAFGTRPFVDRETGIYGVLFLLESGNQQQHIVQRIREVALDTARHELGFTEQTE